MIRPVCNSRSMAWSAWAVRSFWWRPLAMISSLRFMFGRTMRKVRKTMGSSSGGGAPGAARTVLNKNGCSSAAT